MEISFEISRYPLLEMISENLLCAAEFHRNMASLYGVIVRNEIKDGKVSRRRSSHILGGSG